MKAVKINKNGGPEVLELKDITLTKPGNEEVLIEHAAIGLNYIDTYHRSGLYPLTLPSGIGMEGVGVVIKTSSSNSAFNVGDRVAYGLGPPGSYSEARNIQENLTTLSSWQ